MTEACGSIGMPHLDPPFHALVGSREAAHTSRSVVPHVDSQPLPRSAFVRATAGVYVASPALMLTQYAIDASFARLLMEGLELCGTFATSLIGHQTCYGCTPATTAGHIRTFADRCPPRRGIKPLRHVARYLVDGAASPLEAAVFALLCLPPSRGGYGFELPVFNQPVPAGPLTLRPDLYWPRFKVGIEYDSTQFHEGQSALERDSSRRALLGSVGVGIITVTRAQLYNVVEFHAVALALARAMGRRMRFGNRAFDETRNALRAEVLGGSCAPIGGSRYGTW